MQSHHMPPPIIPSRLSERMLIGIVSTRCQAEAVMHRLEAERFNDDHISVIFPTKGALAQPGLGSFIAAGPLVPALRATTHEISAGLARGLTCLGIPAANAERCQKQLEAGNFLLSVHTWTEDEAGRAKQILETGGARDICVSGRADGRTPPFDGSHPFAATG
jgi:hypothetical protein